MPRWTKTQEDRDYIDKIIQEMQVDSIVEIHLADGSKIEGVVRRANVGNNLGQGELQYWGACEIHSKDGRKWVVDFIDIKSVRKRYS